MAEVEQISPYLVDYIRQRTTAAINNASNVARPESLDLGERTRRIDVRAPFVLTVDSFARTGRYIVLWANPTTWQWSIKQRGTIQKTRGGSVRHMWRDRLRRTYFDEPEVNITFQTGNLIPIRTRRTLNPSSTEVVVEADGSKRQRLVNAEKAKASIGGSGETVTTIPPGLLNFYEFFEMIDEPTTLDDGSMNYTTIIASTTMFPQLVLKGFFNPDSLSFAETAEDPNNVEWTCAFTVTSTYPEITSSRKLRAVFESMSGKSSVNMVLMDKRGLRRDSEGNVDINRPGPNTRTPPRAGPNPDGPSPATTNTPNTATTPFNQQEFLDQARNPNPTPYDVSAAQSGGFSSGRGPLDEALLTDVGGPIPPDPPVHTTSFSVDRSTPRRR